MSNKLLTASIITNKALMELKNQLGFTKGVNRQYDDQFAKTGAKRGDTINIRKPVRSVVSDGAALVIQDQEDESVPLKLDKHKHIGFQFSDKDLALSIDEFNDRYIKPKVTTLANQIDYDGCLQYLNVSNFVGTPGTQPSTQATALQLALQAGQKLSESGAPLGDRHMVLNPASEVAMIAGLAGLHNHAAEVGKQYKDGRMYDALGFGWRMDQNIAAHTVGPLGGTPAVKTTVSTEGATSVVTKDWTAAAASRLKAGDVITFGSVYAVNPQTKVSTGSLKQFVVTEDFSSDSSGEGTVKISPAIYTEGPKQNVDSFPQASAAILIFGHASSYADKVTPANLAFHKDAFILGMADFELPKGVDMAARASDPESGLSISFVRQYDINMHRRVCRLDVLYGWLTAYPELACRVHG